MSRVVTAQSPMLTSARDDWRTPRAIVSLVHGALGGIDLDSCADSEDPAWTGAKCALTRADDGLAAAWYGRVYMNPPYGASIAGWVAKFLAEFAVGHTDAGAALVPARPDTRWWCSLVGAGLVRPAIGPLILFPAGRLRFVLPGATEGVQSAPFPSALVVHATSLAAYGRAEEHLRQYVKTHGGWICEVKR